MTRPRKIPAEPPPEDRLATGSAAGPSADDLQGMSRRLTLLGDVVATVHTGLSPRQVIDRIVDRLAAGFPDLRAAYTTVAGDGAFETAHAVEPAGMPAVRGATGTLAASPPLLRALASHEIVTVPDVGRDPRFAPLGELLAERGAGALLGVASPHAEGTAGLLSLEAPGPREWDEDEVTLLTEVAAYLFLAIQDARHRSEREAAEETLRSRSSLERLLVAISTRLINLPSSHIDVAIEEMLAELGRSIGADAILIFLLSADRSRLDRAYEWLVPEIAGNQDRPTALEADKLPELLRTVARLEPFHVPRVADLPAEASAERLHLECFGIRSLLAVPISTRGELLGFVGLAGILAERIWPGEAISVLRVVGDIVGGALDRKRSEEALAEVHLRLEATNRELEESNRKMALLNELGDLLQSCQGADEAIRVIRALLPRLFAEEAGGVYLLDAGTQLLEGTAVWGVGAPGRGPFGVSECWGLRRGRLHVSGTTDAGPRCRHVEEEDSPPALCIPLMAQGEALGILHLRGPAVEAEDGRRSARTLQIALSCAEHLALGLANLRLREGLRSQALRDPLTGLFNRRFLEEQLARELRHAERQEASLGLLMIDLDHFKAINDAHGHEAGDRVLAELGRLLQQGVRSEDVVARYGGEEFTVLLPETDLGEAVWVAEKLRQVCRRLQVRHRGVVIEALQISVGAAAFPACGEDAEELLRAADHALYQAKREGRDRVVAADASAVPVTPALGLAQRA
jgi:diguanylate cyclase (GGDEF)-like protein